jgi:hypothetical protein
VVEPRQRRHWCGGAFTCKDEYTSHVWSGNDTEPFTFTAQVHVFYLTV